MYKKSPIILKAIKYVNKLLLPLEGLYYHQYNHSLEVMDRCIYLGKKENVDYENLEILALAGLFHDTGFVIQYDDNEILGAKIARNYLKTVLYDEFKIKKIEKLIIATKPSNLEPKNLLERIIKDADLDNLGRDDFFEKKIKMKRELELIKNIKIKDPDWNHGSLQLLKEHKFYTETQKLERGIKKIENRKILESLISKAIKK